MTSTKKASISLDDIAPENRQALSSLLQEKEEKLQEKEEKIKSLQHQLDWFKRQLFGQKSEKKDFTDNPYQSTIAELFKELPQPPKQEEGEKKTITYQRGTALKKDFTGTPEGSQLRFDESVPVEEIHCLHRSLKARIRMTMRSSEKNRFTVLRKIQRAL